MSPLLLPFALSSGPRREIPIAVADGGAIEQDRPIRVGIVGGYHLAPPSLDQDLREASLDLVILAGDAVERGTMRAYRDLSARLSQIPLSPMPGPGERRGDRRLRRYERAFSGLSVRGLDADASWRAFDLASGGSLWRVVQLDVDRESLGRRFWDERFWLPKVVSGGTEPLIVLLNAPLSPLSQGGLPSPGAAEIYEALLHHTAGGRIALVAAPGGAPSLSLPGGIWGESRVEIGRVGGAPSTLLRASGDLALSEDLDLALSTWLSERSEDAVLLEAGLDYDASRWPLLGWWLLEIDGEQLHLALRLTRNDTWQEVFRATWSRNSGWSIP